MSEAAVDALLVDAIEAGYFRDVPILNGASLRVGRGEMVTIVGPNGAGKSTLVRVVIGLLEPRMLLLDEPLAGVNRTLGATLLQHIDRLRGDRGMTILLVEHDMDVVMRYSDTVVVMGEGRVITSGTPDEVRADHRVIEAYLGAAVGEEGAADE